MQILQRFPAANHGLWQELRPHQQPVPTTRRRRSASSNSPTSPPALQAAQPPWLEHHTLSGLQDRLNWSTTAGPCSNSLTAPAAGRCISPAA